MRKIFLMALVALVILTIVALVVSKPVMERYLASRIDLQQETLFTLPTGTGRIGLEKLLQEQGIITNVVSLRYILRVNPGLAQFKAGTYRLQPGMTVSALFKLLNSGKEAQFSIRFIEGTRMQDWLQIIQQAPYLSHTLTGLSEQQIAEQLEIATGDRAEGWLYPDTYLYTAGTSDLALLKRSHQRMQAALNEAWQERDKNLPYNTAYEMLIMASIIEKETSVDTERDKVSSVFMNRMRVGMRLQTDPTVIYGMGNKYNGSITRKDLDTPTPYNTYTISGLPPTPIAMPSIASVKAAAHPAKTAYFYFVADGKGGHVFNTNLQAHNRSVRDWRAGRGK